MIWKLLYLLYESRASCLKYETAIMETGLVWNKQTNPPRLFFTIWTSSSNYFFKFIFLIRWAPVFYADINCNKNICWLSIACSRCSSGIRNCSRRRVVDSSLLCSFRILSHFGIPFDLKLRAVKRKCCHSWLAKGFLNSSIGCFLQKSWLCGCLICFTFP